MDANVALAWLTLLVGFPLCAFTTLRLRKRSRRSPHLRVLWERYIVMAAITFVVLFYGLIFVNNDQAVPPLSLETTKLLTRTVMFSLALISAIGWLYINRKFGRRRKDDDEGG